MSKELTNLQDDFVKCRSWGHEWDTFTPLGRRASWGLLLSLRCVRCGTERHDTIDMNGDLSTREYKYPDGYQLVRPKDSERISAAELRLEVLRRLRKPSRRLRSVK